MKTMDSGFASRQVKHSASVVLQPHGDLDHKTSAAFQVCLEQALRCVTQAVVIDLIWVEAIDPAGLEMLKASVHLAARLGRGISFKSLPAAIWAELEIEQRILHRNALGSWATACREDFDRFLTQPYRLSEPPEDNSSGDNFPENNSSKDKLESDAARANIKISAA